MSKRPKGMLRDVRVQGQTRVGRLIAHQPIDPEKRRRELAHARSKQVPMKLRDGTTQWVTVKVLPTSAPSTHWKEGRSTHQPHRPRS